MHLHLGPRGGRWGGEKEGELGARGPCPAWWQQRTKLSGVSPKTAQGPLACDPVMVESITVSSPQPQPHWLVARIGPMSVNSFVFRGTDFRAPSGGGRFPARRGRHPRGRADLIPLIYTLLKPLAPAISPGHEPRRKDEGQDQQRSRLLQSSTRWAEGSGKVNRLPINPAAPSELLRTRETGAASAQCGPVTAGLHDFLLGPHTWAPPRKPLKGPLGAHGRWGGTLRSLGTSAELGGEAKSLDHQVQPIKHRASICLWLSFWRWPEVWVSGRGLLNRSLPHGVQRHSLTALWRGRGEAQTKVFWGSETWACRKPGLRMLAALDLHPALAEALESSASTVCTGV